VEEEEEEEEEDEEEEEEEMESVASRLTRYSRLPAYSRDWHELTETERRACRALGWDEAMWRDGDETPLDLQSWERLDARHQAAAKLLGYEEEDFAGAAAADAT
jgi:hypothetical protein